MQLKNLKYGQTMKTSNTLENYISSIGDKQDGIWNYKTITLLYDIFQEKQIQKQIYCLEEKE